jgi:hypothetical protein
MSKDRKLGKETKAYVKKHMELNPGKENPGSFKEGRLRSTGDSLKEIGRIFRKG